MPDSQTILVVDDDESIRFSCVHIFSREGYLVVTAASGEEGIDLFRRSHIDVTLLDLKMPGMDGLEVMKEIRAADPNAMVVMMTAFGTIQTAVDAMKEGAQDFIEKPFTPELIRQAVRRVLEMRRLLIENVLLHGEVEKRNRFHQLIGQSKGLRNVVELLKRAAPTDATVLITGESGTGKEMVATEIHRLSSRKDKPFVTVDCGALVETLFESEIFGHVKGSFTGATATKYGRLELADGGIIFFDEIGNIGPNIQAKLLRVIQEKEFNKVGSSALQKIDVRVIAATNKNLEQGVKDGTFSDALFYRLNVIPIHLPPLRERKEDIPLLAEHFMKKYNFLRRRDISGISEAALELLTDYEWPGNVRELENIIERGVVLAKGRFIKDEDLLFSDKARKSAREQEAAGGPRTLEDLENEHIKTVLDMADWHIGRASRILGIDRKTLRLKIRKFNLTRSGERQAQ